MGNPKKPKKLFIAHRSSPSEFTLLMVEQYNLQKQLEQNQSLQKFSSQQLLQTPGVLSQPISNSDGYKSHSRTPSYNGLNHRRTGSGVGSSGQNQQGHARRHSLGLTEAMKAAATQKQSNMAHSISQGEKSPSRTGTASQADVASYRFPNNAPSVSNVDDSLDLSGISYKSLAYGQQSFKFPPDNDSNTQSASAWVPPVPAFGVTQSPDRSQNRRSQHFRSNSRNYDNNTNSNINTNWRSQQLPMGGSHQRSSSINSTLTPPSFFVPGHKDKSNSFGGNNSISSLSHFNQGSQGQGANTNGRKSLFAPYLPQSSLPELINEGRLVTGILRVNKKNRSDAYVSTDGLLDADIFICGSKDRNRALEGDLVAVELLVVDEVWELKKEKEEKKRRKDNISTKSNAMSVLSDDIHNDATSTLAVDTSDKGGDSDADGLGRRGSLKQRPTMKKNDDVEVEGQALLLVEEEEINDEAKPLYAGHVVAVVDRIPGQIFSGTLGLLRPAQAAQAANDKRIGKEPSVQTPKAPKIVWFKPTDKRVPLIAIPTEQAPRDFVENHESYADSLFVASIKRWPITSLHPFGTLVTKLGKIDDADIGIESILRDNNFLADEYAGEAELGNDYISTLGGIPDIESELTNPQRTEYFNHYIIAFLQNGQFVDHALHVKRLSDARIELGFHAADISHFVQAGSSLERKAKKRSLSVFLPQKVSHLYPLQLNELASFKENEKGLSISVVFEIDTTTFEVCEVHINESVIIPKALVTYDSVDKILSGGVVGGAITSATSDYIKTFGLIAKEFRRQRLQDRTLGSTPVLPLLDQLDDEKVKLHLNIFETSSALSMVLEICAKVNQTVAQKTFSALGGAAFLRRQALPTLQKIEAFARKAANLGFKIDTSTSASLQRSILRIEDPVKRQCIEILLYKCMPNAKYFVAKAQEQENYGHCYLNLPIYTHFTAPLRRFADLIVQRQLKQAIAITDSREVTDVENDFDTLKTIADYCNFKKDCAASAQEQAIHLLLSQTINDMSEHAGQMLVMGIVVQVYESSFDVVVPEFGIEKRVHGDQLPLVKAEFDKSSRVLELYWEKGVDSATYVPPDERSSLSYRSSIKNKYRTSALEAAKIQHNTMKENDTIAPEGITERLAAMNIGVPKFSNLLGLQTQKASSAGDDLAPYLADCIMRVEGYHCVQEIRELKQVPVLLRAEIGMSLPCLTVRVLNPFAN